MSSRDEFTSEGHAYGTACPIVQPILFLPLGVRNMWKLKKVNPARFHFSVLLAPHKTRDNKRKREGQVCPALGAMHL